jgi:hypothetical protein
MPAERRIVDDPPVGSSPPELGVIVDLELGLDDGGRLPAARHETLEQFDSGHIASRCPVLRRAGASMVLGVERGTGGTIWGRCLGD